MPDFFFRFKIFSCKDSNKHFATAFGVFLEPVKITNLSPSAKSSLMETVLSFLP